MQILDLKSMTPIDEVQFRQEHRNVAFPTKLTPSALEGFGFALFNEGPRPANTPCREVKQGPFTGPNADGTYTRTWIQAALPLEQCKTNLLNIVSHQRHMSSGHSYITFQGVDIDLNHEMLRVWGLVSILPVAVKGRDNKWLNLDSKGLMVLMGMLADAMQKFINIEYAHVKAIQSLKTSEEAAAYDPRAGWTI